MMMPFGFGGRFGKKQTYHEDWDSENDVDELEYEEDFSEEEYIEEEYSEAMYKNEEYNEDEYSEDEYSGDECSEDEYSEDEYSEGEYSEDEYSEDENSEKEYSEEEHSDGEYLEEEDIDEEYVGAKYLDGEYTDEEYTDEEYTDEEYVDEEYTDEELPEEEYIEAAAAAIMFSEAGFEEINYDEETYLSDSYAVDDSCEEYDCDDDGAEEKGAGLLPFFNTSGIVDKLITICGAAVLLAGLIIGGWFIYTGMAAGEEEEFLNVGNQLAQIEVIGQSGLLAVSDAQRAALEAAEIVEEEKEEESTEYEEEDYKTEVTVKLSMSSIEKDLKIKFINQDTGKLVGNVPFSIQITDPDGKESFWSDDDMDGIIYKKNLSAGSYKISVNAFSDSKYKKYGLPSGTQKVEVKDKIEYKKVDVANEVKTESQVDVQKEDTKKNETVVESYLTDTVPWVESTATLISYTEVAKENIVNPMQLAMNTGFVRLAAGNTVSGGDAQSPSPSPGVSPSPSPGVSPSPSPGVSPSPVPTPEPMVLTLDKKTAAVYVDHPVTINVTKVENEMEGAVITATSSNTGVAAVAVQDKTITITGIAAGEAAITVNCSADVEVSVPNEDGEGTVKKTETFEAEPVVCSVVVKANPQKDTTTVLKDNQGNDVYVLDGETYRVAHYADYYTYSKFYIKGEAKYTGWQTLEGKRYFYDASGKAVTGEQVIQGVKYNFASDGSLVTGSGTLGIDVSKWNGNIDWTAVKNSGVSYVIIRCGYRGSSEGALIVDSKFETNIKGAVNAGLKVGVYFFSQAIDKNEAVEEASMVLDCVKNYKISYPIFLDVEPSGGRADSLDVAARTEICKTFCETIQSYGYTAGIYANKTWFTEKINTSELSGYKIWLAQYASEPTYSGRYDMWQYKSTGKIDGISGDVDMNLSYLGY